MSSVWMSGMPSMGVRPRTRHAISTIHVTQTATQNSSAIPSGLWQLRISQQGKTSPTTMSTRSMTSPQSLAIAVRRSVVGISLVPNIGTVSRRQRGIDIDRPTTKRDSERIAPEYIHGGHDYEQDRRLPPLVSVKQIGLAKHDHQHDCQRHQRCHPIYNADEPPSGCG